MYFSENVLQKNMDCSLTFSLDFYRIHRYQFQQIEPAFLSIIEYIFHQATDERNKVHPFKEDRLGSKTTNGSWALCSFFLLGNFKSQFKLIKL